MVLQLYIYGKIQDDLLFLYIFANIKIKFNHLVVDPVRMIWITMFFQKNDMDPGFHLVDLYNGYWMRMIPHSFP